MVDGFKTKSVADWAKRHIASGSAVISDGLACFKAVKEATRAPALSPGQPDRLDHPGIQLGKHDDRNVKNPLRAVAIRSGAKHYQAFLRNTVPV